MLHSGWAGLSCVSSLCFFQCLMTGRQDGLWFFVETNFLPVVRAIAARILCGPCSAVIWVGRRCTSIRLFWDRSAEVSTNEVQKFFACVDNFVSSFSVYYSLDNCFPVSLLHPKPFFCLTNYLSYFLLTKVAWKT